MAGGCPNQKGMFYFVKLLLENQILLLLVSSSQGVASTVLHKLLSLEKSHLGSYSRLQCQKNLILGVVIPWGWREDETYVGFWPRVKSRFVCMNFDDHLVPDTLQSKSGPAVI